MSNTTYKYFNPNPEVKYDLKTAKPKKWTRGDCVIRAFCGALEKKWEVIFNEMCQVAAKKFDMPNSKTVIESYAKINGFTKVSLPDYMTVSKFAATHKGTYIVNIRSHVACVKDGCINDTWNCGSYKMKTYYSLDK